MMGQLTNLNWCRIPSISSANLGVLSFNEHYCWWFRNPANSPVEVGSFSHYLKGFSTTPVWMFGISKPSTGIHGMFMKLWEMHINVLWFSNLNHLPSDVFSTLLKTFFYHIFFTATTSPFTPGFSGQVDGKEGSLKFVWSWVDSDY